MKTLYIDCGMGAAGDMLTAALLELLPEGARTAFVEFFNMLGIPGVRMSAEQSTKCGVVGTHVTVTVGGMEEDETMHDHDHSHDHEQTHTHADGTTHSHSHNGMYEIEHLVRYHLPLSSKVKDDIIAVYDIIAAAESKVHGVPVTEIHFHEVGTMDAVADVTAVCMLMDRIGPEQVIVSPINTGSGHVRCAHGILPVPAPATANILIGMPAYSNDIQSELLTPTGAALLKHFATGYGNMPVMTTQAVGYGMGKKDFPVANCVRVMLGESM
ncbi:MAG: LarC family nickel insertion protein [Mogibacterium sp.]|nr:LarC family nickel insertion protein [Mogibacterium sp.]